MSAMLWGVTLPWNLRGEELRPANTFELCPCSDCADTITTSAIGFAGSEARLRGGPSFCALLISRNLTGGTSICRSIRSSSGPDTRLMYLEAVDDATPLVVMRSINLKNIQGLLSLCPILISRPRHLFPPHWKSNQQVPAKPKTLGEKIKRHRLELHLLQTDVAARFNTSSTTISNWERGITIPARRMEKRISEFLSYMPAGLISKYRILGSPCQTCRISPNSPERCLFESICNQLK